MKRMCRDVGKKGWNELSSWTEGKLVNYYSSRGGWSQDEKGHLSKLVLIFRIKLILGWMIWNWRNADTNKKKILLAMTIQGIQWGILLFCPSWTCNVICCINRFTSLCKNLFNLLEFLADAFQWHVHHLGSKLNSLKCK